MRDRRVDPKRLRRLVDALLVKNGWTMRQVADHLGVSKSFLYYLLNEDRQPRLPMAHQLAQRLGCDVEDFTVPVDKPAHAA